MLPIKVTIPIQKLIRVTVHPNPQSTPRLNRVLVQQMNIFQTLLKKAVVWANLQDDLQNLRNLP